jgi:molybdopterin molybdotransferase
MSGADELDEAVALANGSAAASARRSGGGQVASGKRENGEPPRPRASAADRDGTGEGARRGTPSEQRGTSSAQHGEDELAAPDWLAPRTSRDDADRGSRGSRGSRKDPARAHAHDVPWPDARDFAARTASRLPSRALPLDEALHHTLDAPLDALTDLPSFDTSAMDGWAVSGPGPWTLPDDPASAGVLAGATAEPSPLPDGRAVPIATGARIPPGASAVLRYEYGETDGNRLNTAHRPQPGTDIRPRGQECRSGDRLLPAGTQVTPPVLGLAAAAGYDRLTVTARPRAEVLVLGDELLHRGVPRDGRIRDALGPAVAPWLSELGADVIVTRRLGDDAEALHEAVATTTADLLVTTGGTARGPVDHLRPTLARVGARLLIEGVRVRPGHPMLLARLPRRDGTEGGPRRDGAEGGGPYLVGLPGNPLAALSGLATLAAPLIRTLAGLPAVRDAFAHLTDDVQGHPRDTRLVPVAFSTAEADTRSRARPLRYNGPAMLRGVATATALAVVPPGGVRAGTDVQVLPMPWFAW